MTTAEQLDDATRQALIGLAVGPSPREPGDLVREGARLDGRTALALYQAQLASRHLDLTARWMQQQGRGYYTIGSAGH